MPIPGSANPKPILVLGVGNLLLRDDGAGLEMLSRLRRYSDQWGDAVEFVDGGTGGLTLLGEVSGRRAVVVLDAVRTGAEAGTVHILRTNDVLTFGRGRTSTAHESNATELFRISELLGERSEELVAIGIEPDLVETGIGLSERVEGAMESAVCSARLIVGELVAQMVGPLPMVAAR